MARPYHIGVVGLGVAGATAAYLLAGDGHHVTLMERAPDPRPVGAGVLLQRSGQEVLRRLGLLDEIIAHAAPIDELFARHDDGRPLIRNRYADYEPGCQAYGVHRGVLFQSLYRLVRARPVDVRVGCDVIARDVRPDGVFLRDAHGTGHGPFDFVLAADGSRSRLREACGLRASIT